MNQPNARPIICGTDFSEPAQYAADVAVTLAKRLGTRLVLVHGIDERGEIPRHYWPRCMAEDRPHLTAEAARLRELGVDVQEELVGGAPGVNAHLPQVRRVLVATDLSEHGGRAIPHAYSVLDAGGAVCVLHVLKPGEEREPILAQLREMVPAEAAHRDIRTEVEVIENRDTAGGICEAADRFDADLICIGSHGHSSLLAAAMGSVAHAVVARSSRPVLVVRPPSS